MRGGETAKPAQWIPVHLPNPNRKVHGGDTMIVPAAPNLRRPVYHLPLDHPYG